MCNTDSGNGKEDVEKFSSLLRTCNFSIKAICLYMLRTERLSKYLFHFICNVFIVVINARGPFLYPKYMQYNIMTCMYVTKEQDHIEMYRLLIH